jgi:hypothetical protein
LVGAAERVIDHFRLDALDWRTANTNVDAVRRHLVRGSPRRSGAEQPPDSLTMDSARSLIARWHGFAIWAELMSDELR